MFSAGSTGAALAGAVLETGRIRGVARPAIGVILPFPGAPTVLVDAGANADVRPEHLVGFALLGSVFARIRLGLDAPRVGLLNVGEEPGKGNELARPSSRCSRPQDSTSSGTSRAGTSRPTGWTSS